MGTLPYPEPHPPSGVCLGLEGAASHAASNPASELEDMAGSSTIFWYTQAQPEPGIE